MSFQLHKIFVRLRNTIKYILDKNRKACDCPIDCRINTTVEVQKRLKSIAREVHLPSVVQSEFYEATIILFVCKENKKNDFFSTIRLFSVSPRQRSTILYITDRTQAAYALLHPPQCKDVLFSFKSNRKYT